MNLLHPDQQAHIAKLIASGEVLTIEKVAEEAGCSPSAAHRYLRKAQRADPRQCPGCDRPRFHRGSCSGQGIPVNLDRQIKVLQLMLQGWTMPQIRQRLPMNRHQTSGIMTRLRRRLGTPITPEALRQELRRLLEHKETKR